MQRLFILNDTCLTFDKQRGIVSECKKIQSIAYFMHHRYYKVKRQNFY